MFTGDFVDVEAYSFSTPFPVLSYQRYSKHGKAFRLSDASKVVCLLKVTKQNMPAKAGYFELVSVQQIEPI